jgi:hypothetical protein
LTTQNKEQQNTIDELGSAVKEFLKVQSTVKKLQGIIARFTSNWYAMSLGTLTNHQIVKPLTPKNCVDVLHCQTHEENQMSALETQYIQYGNSHEALQAHFCRQQLDTKCPLRCQESVDPTISQFDSECEDHIWELRPLG